MIAANRHRHPPNAHRQRITSEGTQVQRLHRDTLVEPEMPEAADLALVEQVPFHGSDPAATADRKLVKRKLELAGGGRNRHCD